MKKGIFLLSLFLFLLPSWALAASHVYTCADTTNGGDTTCAANVWTIPPTNNSYVADLVPLFNVYGTSSYVTMVVDSNTGGNGKIDCSGSCGSVAPNTFSASVTDKIVTFSVGAGPTAGIDITNNANTFNGVISFLCVSDTIGECVPPVPPVPPAPPAPVDPCVGSFGTTTSSVATTTGCSVMVIDYPALDVFLGIFLFLMTLGWTARYFNSQIHG